MLAIAKQRYPQLHFYHANILDRKALPKKKYAGFWASAIFMHIPEDDWPTLLENVEQIIIPGGVGYITLPQQRPNPASDRDRRFFSFWDKTKLQRMIAPRGWKILASGKMSERTAQWQWFMALLHK